MSFNQSRADSSDTSQYSKTGRSTSFAQRNNNHSGSTTKGGGAAVPQPSSNVQSNGSFSKKSNNAQRGQPTASGFGMNSNSSSNSASAILTAPNSSHLQPPIPAPSAPVAGSIVKQTTEHVPKQTKKLIWKAQSLQDINVKHDPTAHGYLTKGDASKSFPIRFESVSHATLNVMQLPARTSSTPPNMVEQQRDKARRDLLKQEPPFPIPSIPQHVQRSDKGTGYKLKTGRTHPQARKDSQIPSPALVSQTQMAHLYNISLVSMPMLFHQKQIPVKFGGSTSQIQSQEMAGASLPMPKYVGSRKPVKITHPETLSELRLGSASGSRSHQNVPQPQPVTSVSSSRPINNNPNPVYFSAQGAVPLNSAMNPSCKPPLRFGFPASQGPQPASFINASYKPSVLDSSHDVQKSVPSVIPKSVQKRKKKIRKGKKKRNENSQKADLAGTTSDLYNAYELTEEEERQKGKNKRKEMLRKADAAGLTSDHYNAYKHPEVKKESIDISESNNLKVGLDSSHDLQKTVPSVSPASVQVTVKPAIGVLVEKVNDLASSTSSVENVVPQKREEASSIRSQSGCETRSNSSFYQEKPLVSGLSASADEPAPKVVHITENRKKETIAISASIKDQVKAHMKGPTQPPQQVPGQHAVSSLPFQSETSGTKPTDSSSFGESTVESTTTSGAKVVVGSLVTEPIGKRSNISALGEPLNHEGIGTKGVKVFDEGAKRDDLNLKTTAESVCSTRSEIVNQTKMKSKVKVGSNSLEVGSPKISEKGTDDSLDNCKKNTTLVPDVNDSISTNNKVTRLNGDCNVSTLEASAGESESLDSKTPLLATSFVPDDGVTSASDIPSAEPTLKSKQGAGDVLGKEKDVVKLSGSKSSVAKGKKKRKEILQKADAAGTTSHLYNAYKRREENKGSIDTSESRNLKDVLVGSAEFNVHPSEKDRVGKAEPDDWENAVEISTPKFETADNVNIVSVGLGHLDEVGIKLMERKYTRDFLLKFSEICIDVPAGFQVTSHVADALMVPNINVIRESDSTGMATSDTPQFRSSRKIYNHWRPPNIQTSEACWDSEKTTAFLTACISQLRMRHGDLLYPSNKDWDAILESFYNITGCYYEQTQMKKNWGMFNLKKEYMAWLKTMNEKDKLCSTFHDHGIANENMLSEIFDEKPATGVNQWTHSEDVFETDEFGGGDGNEYAHDSCPGDSVRNRSFAVGPSGSRKKLESPTVTLSKTLEHVISNVESQDSGITVKHCADNIETTIVNCLAKLEKLDRIIVGDELYMFGVELMETPSFREIFMGLPNDEVRLIWLKRKQATATNIV